MTTPDFKNAYARLNPRQKEAVDAIEGPVMVIAGPGTGKTQILTLRIANILAKTDTAPENILALTFTESAAANMRRRLADLIGPPAYYVEISTFHGFANRLIQQYPEYFPVIIGGRNATDVDQIAILRSILDKGNYELLKPLGEKYFYVKDILQGITESKRENLDAQAVKALVLKSRREFEAMPDKVHEKGPHAGKMKLEHERTLRDIDKNTEFAAVYAEYEKELRARKLYDFEDMIMEVAAALAKHREFLFEAQSGAQYILVDEHQDTNGAQNRLLELLASFFPNPNLFVVGDEKQAIYRFQGASLENFLYFKNKYPDARLIYLEENYRSTQSILDSAQSLIEHNASTIKAPLISRRGGEERKISAVETESADAEYFYLTAEIKKLLSAGAPPEEIAVLYRENRDAEPVAETLERAGIPFAIESDRNILADTDIRKLLRLLDAINDFGNDELLADALHIDFLGIPPLDVWRILDLRTRKGYPPLWRILGNAAAIEEAELAQKEKLQDFVRNMEDWKSQSRNLNFLEFFENVIRESGFLNHLLANPGYFEKVGRLNALFDEIKKAVGNRGDYGLADFMEYLAILREHKVMLKARNVFVPNMVRLMTAHKAKGLEFDYVFITGVSDGKWGNKRRAAHLRLPFQTSIELSELEKNEDERRLFYMALTRARKHVSILRSSRSAEGRELVPSQFITEIRPELLEHRKLAETAEEAIRRRDAQFSPRRPSEPRLEDRDFLRELFRRRGLSVSALNNYLECPWKYFYVSLLRLPQAETPSQMYGSAMHRALERFFAAKAAGTLSGPGKEEKQFLVDRYTEALGRMPLKKRDLERLLKDGAEVLFAYYDNYAGQWNYRTLTEYKINGVALSEDVILNGKLDKLEFTDMPNEVIVVDYKVKKPESRNWIEGNTANSSGDYKRQLVFYKLLLEGGGESKFKMKSGVIDFVEPNDRGKFKLEEFVIGDGEVQELRQTILAAAEDILSLGFWNRTCGEKDCAYCRLRLDFQGNPA